MLWILRVTFSVKNGYKEVERCKRNTLILLYQYIFIDEF